MTFSRILEIIFNTEKTFIFSFTTFKYNSEEILMTFCNINGSYYKHLGVVLEIDEI